MSALDSSPADSSPAPPPSAPAPTDARLAALQEAYDKSPSNGAARQALVDALVAKANADMADQEMPPREKYPAALGLYRRAAKIDPSNATARAGIDQIEAIYKQMGRPIPEV